MRSPAQQTAYFCDDSHWPVCIARITGPLSDDVFAGPYLECMQSFLEREEPYVQLIAPTLSDPMTRSNRHIAAAWMREHRDKLATYCHGWGFVSSSPGRFRRYAASAMISLVGRVPVPVYLAADEPDAMRWAVGQLERHGGVA